MYQLLRIYPCTRIYVLYICNYLQTIIDVPVYLGTCLSVTNVLYICNYLQVIEEFQNQLRERSIPESTVAVKGSSHLGGHKWAGIVLVYPQGDWYGMISKRNVSRES
jgi:putative effector of murein hydrolase